jgi:hypothetical protein
MTDDANVRDQRPDTTPLQPERAVRLLRAKAAELENRVLLAAQIETDTGIAYMGDAYVAATEFKFLVADIALVAGLLADHIERTEFGFEAVAARFLNEDGTP